MAGIIAQSGLDDAGGVEPAVELKLKRRTGHGTCGEGLQRAGCRRYPRVCVGDGLNRDGYLACVGMIECFERVDECLDVVDLHLEIVLHCARGNVFEPAELNSGRAQLVEGACRIRGVEVLEHGGEALSIVERLAQRLDAP